MAVIKETLVIENQFSEALSRYISLMTEGSASTREMQAAARELSRDARAVASVSRAAAAQNNAAAAAARAQAAQTSALAAQERLEAQQARAAARAQREQADAQRDTRDAASALTDQIKSLVGAYVGVQSIGQLVSAEEAAAAQEMIYQAAQRSRGEYLSMANLVSQLGSMAPEAFSDANGNINTAELVGFAEQLQKQMTISGASGEGASAAMLQLTQALSSGVLRGEELNSVLEQTPIVARTIAEYMGVSIGEMRDLASEGAITADVVKNAMFEAAEETNAAFEAMPLTWGQVWNMAGNIALQALQPVLGMISWGANNLDILAPIVLSVAAAIGVLVVTINGARMATAAWTAAQQLLNLVMSANPVGLVIAGIVLLIGALYAGVAAINDLTGSSVSATGIITGTFAAMGAMILNTSIIPMQNQFANFANFIGNLFNDPVAAVQVLFLDMATNILNMIATVASGIESLINAIPGMEVDITSGLEGFRDNVAAMSQQVKDASDWTEYVKGWDYIDPTEAYMSGYNWGANLNLGDSLGLGSLLGGNDTTGGYSPASIPGYDDIAGAINGVGKDVKGIKKSVDLSNEDMRYMVDLATRRYVNNVNLTSQTPVITINGANTGRTKEDREALAKAIEMVLWEAAAAGAAGSIAPHMAFG